MLTLVAASVYAPGGGAHGRVGGLALVAWAKARNSRLQVLSPLRPSGATAMARWRIRSGSAGQSQRDLEDLSAAKIEVQRKKAGDHTPQA
jgi:hypothetical protein